MSEIRPRRQRIKTVRNKLRKYRNLTRSFCSKKVIMKITISLTDKMTIGKMYLMGSSVSFLSPSKSIVVFIVKFNPKLHPLSSAVKI